MKKIFIKILIYTAIYALITFLISDDLEQLVTGDQLAVINVIGKYILFLLAMLFFDFFIKKYIFKNSNK